jgi:hypothetical protein
MKNLIISMIFLAFMISCTNEKKMIKSKLDILTKESLGLEFKKI